MNAMHMKLRDWLLLATMIIGCELVGIISSLSTMDSVNGWYATIVRPALSPPSWVFGPVWTLLYALMGIAVYLVWRKRKSMNVRAALFAFTIQLILNSIWSPIFFGLHSPLFALVDIVLMWVTIVVTMLLFRRVSPWACRLLLPYLLWVSFASYLNYMIVLLN